MVTIATVVELVNLVQGIYNVADKAQSNRNACKEIATRIQNLAMGPLEKIRAMYLNGDSIPQGTRNILENLKTKLKEIGEELDKLGGHSFLMQLWNQWAFNIEETLKAVQNDIDSCVADLNLTLSVDTSAAIAEIAELAQQQNEMMTSLIKEVESLKAKGVTQLGADEDSMKFIAEVANRVNLDTAALSSQLSDMQAFLRVNMETFLSSLDNLRKMMGLPEELFQNREAPEYWFCRYEKDSKPAFRTFCSDLRKAFSLSVDLRELKEYIKAEVCPPGYTGDSVERCDFDEWTVKVNFTTDKDVFKKRLESHIKEWASKQTKFGHADRDSSSTIMMKRSMESPTNAQADDEADDEATTVAIGRAMNPQLVAASDRLEITIFNEEALKEATNAGKPDSIPVFMNKLYEGGRRPINRAFTKSLLPWDGGRNPQNNIHISEGEVSRLHFTILFSESENMVKLMDRGSVSGTFIRLPANEFMDVFEDMVVILGSTYVQLSTLNNASGSAGQDVTVGRPGMRGAARPATIDEELTAGRPGARGGVGAASAAPSLCLQVMEQSVSGVYDRRTPENNIRVITPDRGAIVGRLASKSSIAFNDSVQSRAHAEFKFNAARGKWQLRDLGTVNGSYYQLRPRVAVPLRRNTIFKVGRYNFLVNDSIY